MKNLKRIGILFLLLVVSTGLIYAAGGRQDGPTRISVSQTGSERSPWQAGSEAFADYLNEKAKGNPDAAQDAATGAVIGASIPVVGKVGGRIVGGLGGEAAKKISTLPPIKKAADKISPMLEGVSNKAKSVINESTAVDKMKALYGRASETLNNRKGKYLDGLANKEYDKILKGKTKINIENAEDYAKIEKLDNSPLSDQIREVIDA